MNLSKIRAMIVQGDMSRDAARYLLRCGCECEYLDYKSALDLNNDHGIADFVRDVVGMKNTGGGYLLIGVEDRTWKPMGMASRLNLDSKMLRDKVLGAAGLSLELDIVQHQLYLDDGSLKHFALILVRGSAKPSKRRNPSSIQKDFHPTEKWGLRRGEIYIRSGDTTIRATYDELEDIFDRLDAEHERQDIAASQEEVSPFEVVDGLYRLLPADYEAFIGRELLKKQVLDAIESDPRIWIVNLHGPGGVGKTALATWAAYEYYRNRRDQFEAILFLSAKERELTASGITHVRPTLYSLENLFENVLVLFEHGEYRQRDLEEQKRVVIDLLRSWKTLLILDNMEAINDGRIMSFVQSLPPDSQARVLLTSRRRTDGWENPIKIEQLSLDETREFLRIRASEMEIMSQDILSEDTVRRIWETTGGLPLAIQWTLGRYAKTEDLDMVLGSAVSQDSPLLEFSFRNSWNALSSDAQHAMAALSILDEPPTEGIWSTILDWPPDRLDHAIEELQSMTFIFTKTDTRTGTITYHSLPITRTFSRNMLATMGPMERIWTARYQEHMQSIQLVAQEVNRYEHLFGTFARTENEKKAVVLSRIAEAQEVLGPEIAEAYYQQAIDVEPRSVYALVKYGRFQISLGRISEGFKLLQEATKYVTKRTGFYVYYNLALAHDAMRQREECATALRNALNYEPTHVHARHMLGVTLSRMGLYDEALAIFDDLIREELSRPDGPTNTLVYAAKTKVISLRKSRRVSEAKHFLSEAIEMVSKYPSIQHLARELEEQLYEFQS